MNIFYTPSFLRLFSKLDDDLQIEVKEKIDKFINKNNHLSLKVHKLKGISNTYSFSVNYKFRIIFEYQDNKDNVNFLKIGNHD